MDRREALKKMAVSGATVVGASVVLSNVAFADGGTVNCRPSGLPSPTITLTPSATNTNAKTAVPVASSVASVAAATCPTCKSGVTPVASVQYRWTVDSPATGMGMYADNAGVTRLDTSFQSSLTTPAYIRNTAGGTLGGTYTVRLTVRWICTNSTSKAWSCKHWIVTFTYSTAGGNDGTVSAVSATTTGSGNSAACDSPTP